MNFAATTVLFLAIQAPAQQPSAFAQAKVLQQVRESGFLPHQVVALRDAAVRVDQASSDRRSDERAIAAHDGDLKPILDALLAGVALTHQQTAVLNHAADQRKAVKDRWNQLVEAAVTRVLATLNDEQRDRLGIPADVRERVDAEWNSAMPPGPEGEKANQQLIIRLMQEQYAQAKSGSGGSTDRGAAQDKRSQSENLRLVFQEIQRQGQQLLVLARSGDRAAQRTVRQQLARSYAKRDMEATLRDLIRSIITSDGASTALSKAVPKRLP